MYFIRITYSLRASEVAQWKRIRLPMQEKQCLITGSGRSPGEETATHSSFLAWEIPWTEEPGGLQSMQSQKSQTWLRD